jgi:hypothetical protein
MQVILMFILLSDERKQVTSRKYVYIPLLKVMTSVFHTKWQHVLHFPEQNYIFLPHLKDFKRKILARYIYTQLHVGIRPDRCNEAKGCL